MPRLGKTYDIEIGVTSRPKSEYGTDEYYELDLPVAPAIMVGDTIVTDGKDIKDIEIENEICRQLGLPAPEPGKKGIIERLFGR